MPPNIFTPLSLREGRLTVCPQCGNLPYQFEPLTSPSRMIRVLQLLPRQYEPNRMWRPRPRDPSGGGICCRLVEKSLEAFSHGKLPEADWCISYEALSYVWGTEKQTRCIRVNGAQCVRVTPNLYAVLEASRLEFDARWLWIDALCISQRDVQERSQQVARMHEIFAAAGKVLVWLGTRSPAMVKPVDKLEIFKPSMIGVDRLTFPWLEPDSVLDIQRKWDILVAYLQELLCADWFTRLWILQEATWAGDIQICHGTLQFSWELLVYLVAIVSQDGTTQEYLPDPTCNKSMQLVRNIERWRASRVSFASQLESLRPVLDSRRGQRDHVSLGMHLDAAVDATTKYLCKDPRDHIFAVLSLAPKVDGSLLMAPDYSLSVDFSQIKMALVCIFEYRSLDVLLYVDHRGTEDLQGPTWVPRWQALAAKEEDTMEQQTKQVRRQPVVRRPPGAPPFPTGRCDGCLESFLKVDPRMLYHFPAFWPLEYDEIKTEDRWLTLPARIVRSSILELSIGEAAEIVHTKDSKGAAKTSFRAIFTHTEYHKRRKKHRTVIQEFEKTLERAVTLPKYVPAAYFRGRRIARFGWPLNDSAKRHQEQREIWAIVPAVCRWGDVLVAFCGWKQGFVMRKGSQRGRTLDCNLVGPCEVGVDMETTPDVQIHLI